MTTRRQLSSVGFVKPRDPRNVEEHVLWTMHKDDRRVEARTRLVPIGVDFIIYDAATPDALFELRWSRTLSDGREVNELSIAQRQAYESDGYVEDLEAMARRIFGEAHAPKDAS